ncbi:MAG TPA: FecR domain-containing protein, partial [Chitinispirillaceae bacterium]|nr:FecR domain-containing protein [Chitinispirillaceae bacterium]
IPFIHNLTNNRHINSEVAFTMPQLIHAEGMVSLNGTIASELRKNQNIVIGSVIATESGAQVIIKADSGSNIALGEKSAVKVKAFSKKNQTFQLDYGTVSVHVAKRKDDQLFSVKTRNAVCEVVGTRFSVEFNGDSSKPSTVLFVKDGCVRFRTLDGNAVLVKSGEKCSINGTVMGEKAVLIRNDRLGEDFESKKSIETVIHNHDKRMIAEKRETDQSTLLPVSDYIRLMREADSLIDKEKFSEALQSIEKVVSSSVMKPDQFYDATMKKVRLMKRLQRYRDAAVLLENVAAGKFRKEYCGNALYQLAILQEKELKNSEKAIESLQKYISEYNDGVMISDAYYSLAVILHEKKDYKAEAIVYNQYIETFGNTESSQRAVYALASLYSKELHDCTRALGLFTHLEQSDPKGVYAEDALFWKANCLNAQGKANMAIAAYKEYLERYPDGRWVMDAKARTLTKNDPGGQKK